MTRPVHVVVVAFHAAGAARPLSRGDSGRAPTSRWSTTRAPRGRASPTARGVAYVDPGRISGFAAGVNVALRRPARGPPVDSLLLNPDARSIARRSRGSHRFSTGTGARALRRGRAALIAADGLGATSPLAVSFAAPCLGRGDRTRMRLPARATFAIGAVLLLRWEALREVGAVRRAVLPLRRGGRLAAASGGCRVAFGSRRTCPRSPCRRGELHRRCPARGALPRCAGDVHPQVVRGPGLAVIPPGGVYGGAHPDGRAHG